MKQQIKIQFMLFLIHMIPKCPEQHVLMPARHTINLYVSQFHRMPKTKYEGWNFNSGNYLFTTDTK